MNAVVIVPSLNPDEKMVNTVKGLLAEGFGRILVVNDGSGPEHLAPFEQVGALPGVTVLTHAVNQGKGRAMKTAFAYILEQWADASGAVTVDGDGQHLPGDVRRCVQAMEAHPEAVVLGVRDFSGPEVPPRSRFGNNLTRLVFRLVCDIQISDTQTGLRAFSLPVMRQMQQVEGERYEYETNQLLAARKMGLPLYEVPIETVYLDDNSSSHFHPIRDSFQIYKVIFAFAAGSLGSFGIDLVMFTALNLLLGGVLPGLSASLRLLLATGGARVISSLFNYTYNRQLVFHSQESPKRSLVRYYALCVCQAAVSYGLVLLLAEGLLGLNGGLLETVIKLVVDGCLFFVSFQIQRRWVFRY